MLFAMPLLVLTSCISFNSLIYWSTVCVVLFEVLSSNLHVIFQDLWLQSKNNIFGTGSFFRVFRSTAAK